MAPWGVASREDPTGEFPEGFAVGFRVRNHLVGKIANSKCLPCPKRNLNYATFENSENILKPPLE